MRESFKKWVPKIIGKWLNTLVYFAPKKTAKIAFKIFSKPRQGKISPHHEAFLNPARSQNISIKGLTLQTYHWQGNKSTILLVHGWESHSHRWKNLVERLQKEDYNIIAFDAPAHGYSTGTHLYVPLYEEALNTMIDKFNPAIVIGHSVGGMTTIYNQHLNKRNSIKKLVILGPPDKLVDILAEYQRILSLNKKVMLALDTYFLKHFGFRAQDFATSIFVKDIETPGLLIHEIHDTITSIKGSRAIHKNWPQAKFIETEGLNHSLYSTQVDDSILAFCNQ